MAGFLGLFGRGRKKGETILSLPAARFWEIVNQVETTEIASRLPDLKGRVSLEVSPRLKPLVSLLRAKGPLLAIQIGATEGFTIRCRWDSLPLQSRSCDWVLCRLPAVAREQSALLREVGRVLRPEGTTLLTGLHPFSPMSREEGRKNPVMEEGLPAGFERYWRVFESAGLAIEEVHELFFDNAFKKFFDEKKVFDQIRKEPFLLIMTLVKR